MRDWAIGFGLLGIGLAGLIGSVTGNLAGMLAALFDPSDLTGGGSGVPANANQPQLGRKNLNLLGPSTPTTLGPPGTFSNAPLPGANPSQPYL